MIDTTVLTMPSNAYTIMEPEKFQPSAKILLDDNSFGSRAFITCKQNPTKTELLSGNYKPRLTLTKRWTDQGFTKPLKIEFSAPKLLFKNNFDELTDKDFDALINQLLLKLKEMGVYVFKHNLENAMVSAMHFSKNFILTDYTTSSMILNQISKIDLSGWLDLNKTKFRNSGYSLQYHANSYEVAFYDKLQDMQQAKKTEKKAIEKENSIQMNLFERIPTDKPFEVFRMEIRIGNRQKMKHLFGKLAIQSDLTFKELFKAKISQKVLLYFWNTIAEKTDKMLSTKTPTVITEKLLRSGSLNLNEVLKVTSLLVLLNESGEQRIKQMLGSKNLNYWYRSKKLIERGKLILGSEYQTFSAISKGLATYEPTKLTEKFEKLTGLI